MIGSTLLPPFHLTRVLFEASHVVDFFIFLELVYMYYICDLSKIFETYLISQLYICTAGTHTSLSIFPQWHKNMFASECWSNFYAHLKMLTNEYSITKLCPNFAYHDSIYIQPVSHVYWYFILYSKALQIHWTMTCLCFAAIQH